MLSILGGLLSSVVSGGATGILGVIAQRFADYKNKQLDIQLEAQRHADDLAMKKVDAEIMAQEWAARTQVAQVEAAGKEAVAADQAFAASYSLEPKTYSNTATLTPGQNWVMVFLDFLRGMVRPLLTIYLCVLVTIIYFLARDKVRAEDLSADQSLALLELLVQTILYVWTTITLWWFGTRNKNAPPSGQQPSA